jgi:hypothetical protein
LNLRPSGYEPDELPGCSTPHQVVRRVVLAPAGLVVKSRVGFRRAGAARMVWQERTGWICNKSLRISGARGVAVVG